MNLQSKLIPFAAAAALAVAACGKKETPAPEPAAPAAPVAAPAPPVPTAAPPVAPAALTVVGFELGKAVDAEKRVTAPQSVFAPADTIYLTVATEGSAASAVLTAKWTYGGDQTIKEDSITIAPTGPSSTAFSVSKPDGWPVGKYAVAVTLDGNPVGGREFEVQ